MKKVFGWILIMCLICSLVGCNEVSDFSANSDYITNQFKASSTPTSIPLSYESTIDKLKEKYNVEYLGKDIEYNMSNMLDKEFLVAGMAELSDYYNYGYSDFEDTSFCIKIEPMYDTSKGTWYIYLGRESCNKLYEDLLIKGSTLVVAICEIDTIFYEEGQGNLAHGNNINW